MYGVWAVTLLDLHFFLGNVVAAPLGRLGTVSYLPLVAIMLLQAPVVLTSARAWVWYPALLLLLLISIATLPTATNVGYARDNTKLLLVYYVLAIATTVYVRTGRQALPILGLLLYQFAWWALHAGVSGGVWWDPSLANTDGFGGLMVQGAGLCFWFGLAVRSKRLKALSFAIAAYCVVGVVTSFARGAFLSLVALAVLIWVRSPRKLATATLGLAGVVIVIAASALLFPEGAFWAEILSSFSEGTEQGTGGMRWALWGAALEVFKQHPILGVGAGNFGAFAANFFRPGSIELFPDPMMLYGMNLHNSYMQILSEFGLVGAIAFIWLMVDFQKRNRALREPGAIERWKASTGGGFDLRYLALGLETANAANFLAGVFYASLFMPWFFTVWAANRMLWAVTRPESKAKALQDRSSTRMQIRHSPND